MYEAAKVPDIHIILVTDDKFSDVFLKLFKKLGRAI